jgi:hypothetical protein
MNFVLGNCPPDILPNLTTGGFDEAGWPVALVSVKFPLDNFWMIASGSWIGSSPLVEEILVLY